MLKAQTGISTKADEKLAGKEAAQQTMQLQVNGCFIQTKW